MVRQQLPQPTLIQQPDLYLNWNRSIAPHPMVRAPLPQAMVHSLQQMIVGGVPIVPIGTSSAMAGMKRSRGGRPKGSKTQKHNSEGRRCGRCMQYNGDNQLKCPGRGGTGREGCKYFFENGSMKPCSKCNHTICKGGENGNSCDYM